MPSHMRNHLRSVGLSCASFTVPAAVIVVALVGTSSAMAQANYSRNCKPTSSVYISEGTYEGTFETTVTASLGEQGISISQEIHLSGKFTLTVDRSTKARGTLTGEVADTFKMKGLGEGISMPGQSAGKMSLALSELEDDSFTATAKMTGSGTVSAKSADVDATVPLNWNRTGMFTFTATHATCDAVDGTLRITTLDEAVTNLEMGGAKVSRTPIAWSMKNKVSMADRESKLRDELAQAVQGMTDATRDAVSTRLARSAIATTSRRATVSSRSGRTSSSSCPRNGHSRTRRR